MPQTVPREPRRIELAVASDHLQHATEALHELNMRKMPNGPLKDAARDARGHALAALLSVRKAIQLDGTRSAEELRKALEADGGW